MISSSARFCTVSRIVLGAALGTVMVGLAGCGSDDTVTRSTTTQTTTPSYESSTPSTPTTSTTTTTTQQHN